MTGEQATTDICDERGDDAAVCDAPLSLYGRRRQFAGPVQTVRCFEDNVLMRELLGTPGEGRVLVVDGGGSHRVALMGDVVAQLGTTNGWAGVVINGAVRDVSRLAEIDLGVMALGSCPRRSRKHGEGVVGEPVTFGGATFSPGDLVTADADGLVVLADV